MSFASSLTQPENIIGFPEIVLGTANKSLMYESTHILDRPQKPGLKKLKLFQEIGY